MKILIIAGFTPSLVNFRGDLIQELVSLKNEVVAIGPDDGYNEEISTLGARFILLPFNRVGINPINDLVFLLKLIKLFRHEQPDLVISYTVKPVIFGSIAAKLAGIDKIFSMVTGLGFVFTSDSIQAKMIGYITKKLYSAALQRCVNVFFQNTDDIKQFVDMKLVKPSQAVLVNGSGVNLERFQYVPIPPKMSFLMICRILKDKGVLEYLEAAKAVKKRYNDVDFKLIGYFDSNPNSLQYKDIETYIKSGIIQFLGEKKDVREFISSSSVYVLPSYREGTPRTVLEAMAMGRPIITTDAPGCRETVIDGVNGFLVPVKNIDLLAEKMIWMIENPDECHKMGWESLKICREKYDVRKVNEAIIKTMEL